VLENLSTEICTSRQKRFNLVNFVDTPGLVDGYMKYPFDVDQVFLWLGSVCDLILVFFDPMGQALCKRTLNIVQKLSETHGEKLRFYLSKADEAGSESDRQPNHCVNHIQEVCKTIEKTINQTVQNTLNTLDRDCDVIAMAITDKLSTDSHRSAGNLRCQCMGCILGLLGFLLPSSLLAVLLLGGVSKQALVVILGEDTAETLTPYVKKLYEDYLRQSVGEHDMV
ncbi:hypothetical protein JZ751_026370, partial [Albula glossodonta]